MRLPFTVTLTLWFVASITVFAQEPNEKVRVFPLRQLVGDRYETLVSWDIKNQLYRVRKNGLYGLIDAQGREIVPPEYDWIGGAQSELIAVQKNDKWGAFNRQGRLIIPIQYDAVDRGNSHDSRFVIVQQDTLSAVFDERGKMIAPFEYADYPSLYKNKIYGRLAGQPFRSCRDSTGKQLAPDSCESISQLFGSYWKACKSDLCAIFDSNRHQLTDFIFPDNSLIIPIPGNRLAIDDTYEDDMHLYDYNGKRLTDSVVEIFWVNDNTMWINLPEMRGFLRPNGAFVPIVKGFSLVSWWEDRKGALIKTFKLTASEYSEDGPRDVYGWIDTRNGNFMPPHFDQVVFWDDKIVGYSRGITYVFSQDNELMRRLEGSARFFPGAPCAIYYRYDHFALIDTTFDYLTPPSYQGIIATEWGGLLFERDGKWGLLDTKGKELLPPQYDKIEPSEPHSQWLTIQLNGKKGVETMNGKTVLEARFEFIRGIPGCNFVVRDSGKYRIINKKNEVLLPLEFDSVRIRSDGRLMVVRRDGRFGMVNFKGEILLPVEYEQLVMEDSWIVGVRNGLYNAWNATIVGMDTFKYDWWSPEYPYGFIVKKNGKAGFINLLGKVILPLQYDEIRRVYPEPGEYHVLKSGQTTIFKP